MASLNQTEKVIKDLMQFTYKLNSENLLAVALIYPSVRKSPPNKKLVEEIIKNRHGFSPGFSISDNVSFEMRKLDPLSDFGIDKSPGNILAPMLAKKLKDTDLSSCEAIAYKDIDKNFNAWIGALFIGIVAKK